MPCQELNVKGAYTLYRICRDGFLVAWGAWSLVSIYREHRLQQSDDGGNSSSESPGSSQFGIFASDDFFLVKRYRYLPFDTESRPKPSSSSLLSSLVSSDPVLFRFVPITFAFDLICDKYINGSVRLDFIIHHVGFSLAMFVLAYLDMGYFYAYLGLVSELYILVYRIFKIFGWSRVVQHGICSLILIFVRMPMWITTLIRAWLNERSYKAICGIAPFTVMGLDLFWLVHDHIPALKRAISAAGKKKV